MRLCLCESASAQLQLQLLGCMLYGCGYRSLHWCFVFWAFAHRMCLVSFLFIPFHILFRCLS